MENQLFSDFGVKDTVEKYTSKHKETGKRSRSRSPQQRVESKIEGYVNCDIPNRQFGDLYCEKCDSHMNSEEMWEKHIVGKRHLKNLRKGEPVAKQKYEYTNEEPAIRRELDRETRPIAGLDHICEILRDNQPILYQCFLCSANLTTSKLLMEHITGLKHQMAFLKEHVKEKYYLVDSSKLSKSNLEPIVQDLISKYEQEHGRGKISVKKEKKKSGSLFSKKKVDDDGDKRPLPKPSKYSPTPKSSRYSPPKSSRYSPPKSSKCSPPKSSRYSSPKSCRYSPPKSSKCSPPKSSRYSSPKSCRYSPPKYSRYSPSKYSRYSPPKSARMKERQSESEWNDSPEHEILREKKFAERLNYCDKEELKNNEPEYPIFRRASTHTVVQDSRLQQENSYSRALPSFYKEKNYRDLREVLEQNKSVGMTLNDSKANMGTASIPFSSEINNVSDDLLRLLHDTSLEEFLWLALFKFDNVDVKESIEFKLLNRVSLKAATLALNAENQFKARNLKAKYKETLARNGVSFQDNSMMDTSSQGNLLCTQNSENFFGHFKARKTTVYEDVYSSRVKSSELYIDKKPMSRHKLSHSTPYENSPEIAVVYDSGSNRGQSDDLPFENFPSAPTCIPVLISTKELSPRPETATVMSHFTQNRQKYVWKRQTNDTN